jgi:hypothetical protein
MPCTWRSITNLGVLGSELYYIIRKSFLGYFIIFEVQSMNFVTKPSRKKPNWIDHVKLQTFVIISSLVMAFLNWLLLWKGFSFVVGSLLTLPYPLMFGSFLFL